MNNLKEKLHEQYEFWNNYSHMNESSQDDIREEKEQNLRYLKYIGR